MSKFLNLFIVMNAYSREYSNTETIYNIITKQPQNQLACITYVYLHTVISLYCKHVLIVKNYYYTLQSKSRIAQLLKKIMSKEKE